MYVAIYLFIMINLLNITNIRGANKNNKLNSWLGKFISLEH